jgi:hypothetical protein
LSWGLLGEKFEILKTNNYRDKNVLELHESWRSAIKNCGVPFASVQPLMSIISLYNFVSRPSLFQDTA